MKLWNNFKISLAGISQSFLRFPITAIWLIALAVINAIQIENNMDSYGRFIYTCLVGAMLAVVAEHLYERFFVKKNQRWILLAGSVVLAIGYSSLLPSGDFEKIAYSIRTFVILFALFIAFIWIPTIRNQKVFFHQSFLATLKAGFITVLFAGVLTAGVSAIIAAVDRLLFTVDWDFLWQILNIVWTLFASMYFLTLLPKYFDPKHQPFSNDRIEKKDSKSIQQQKTLADPFDVPRFFEVLLTYIVIPLTAVYTIILLVYVVMNIGGEFWTDNLLEPMLVSYALIVIIVYLLSCNIENKITVFFRKVFPKIMLPIVLFQTVSSVLKIQEMGITYGRYYVILFGVFATVAGVVFSFLPPSKNGFIAITLLVLAGVSIIPPIDAFTVARNSQLDILNETLQNNEMLQDDRVLAKSDIPIADKVLISRSLTSLYDMDELDRFAYLPTTFEPYGQEMEVTFGFPYTYSEEQDNGEFGQSAYLEWQSGEVIFLEGTDYMVRKYIYSSDDEFKKPIQIKSDYNEETYMLTTEKSEPYYTLRLLDSEQIELISVDLQPLFEQAFATSSGKAEVTQEDMTWIEENEWVKITIIAMSLDEYSGQTNADLYVFIDIK